ncbi:hypothetical protein NA57DRAFT_52106 [Rhizodiscina lignyota]|uniref:Uncharacterized protein n=1 Tax=Rhizodiscina lignyota TaxID=1504668 RepID=A0A9P4M994_9PEZI|nr:hypothetical protein NA57DRAFT_52106 [Rhizodiscina lignyota]
MLRRLLVSLLCHSLLVAAFPQITLAPGKPGSPSKSSSSEFTTSSLRLTTSASGTGPAASCPSSCSFDGPLITGYHWIPVVANQTITATVILLVAPITANVSGPYGNFNRSGFTIVDTQTEYNNLPPEVTIPFVGENGSALGQATTTGTDGVPTAAFITYPTNVLDYQSSFHWTGALPAPTGGSSACASTRRIHIETLPSHPAYTASSALPTNVDGTNFEMVPAQFVDAAFLRSAFPEEEAFRLCTAPIALANQTTAVTRPVWVTVTTYANATLRPFQSNAPMIEHTVPSDSDDSGLGNFTPFIAHTEVSVPITGELASFVHSLQLINEYLEPGDGNSASAFPKAHTEQSVGGPSSTPSAAPDHSGGHSGGAQAVDTDGNGNSGSSGGGLAGVIASIVDHNPHPSPGGGAGASGPQATSGPGSSSSGSEGQSGSHSSGQSSNGQSGSSGGSGQSSSNGAGSSGSSSGSSSGGSHSGGSSSESGSSGSGSSGSSSSGSGSAQGGSSGGQSGGNSGSGSGSSSGGQSGASGSSKNGAHPGSGPAPAQSIAVGSTTLSVIHTTVMVTSHVGGATVTTNVPVVVIGGSTATLGQTLTFDNTPVAFAAAPTSGPSSSNSGSGSGSGFGSGVSGSGSSGSESGASSNSGSNSESNSGSGASGSGSGSSGSSSSSNSNSLGSGDQLIIDGTSTVPLLPIATGSSSGSHLPAPVTIGSQIVAPTALPSGNGIGFIISGQTLAPTRPITLGTGSHTTVVSLTTNSQGQTLLVQGSGSEASTQTLGSGLPPITVGSQLVEPTALPNGGEGFIISGQTLAPGHPITLGTGSHTTVVSLTTNNQGETLLVQGTSTQTLGGLPPLTLGSQVVEPTDIPGEGEGFVISGQTLALGHPVTLGTGSHTTVLSLTTDSAGDTLLVEGTSTRTLAGPHSTGSIGGFITTGISGPSGGSNNSGSTTVEQSNGSGSLIHGNGKAFLDLDICMAMVMGMAATIFIL